MSERYVANDIDRKDYTANSTSVILHHIEISRYLYLQTPDENALMLFWYRQQRNQFAETTSTIRRRTDIRF